MKAQTHYRVTGETGNCRFGNSDRDGGRGRGGGVLALHAAVVQSFISFLASLRPNNPWATEKGINWSNIDHICHSQVRKSGYISTTGEGAQAAWWK